MNSYFAQVSFPPVGNPSLKARKDSGQAGMTENKTGISSLSEKYLQKNQTNTDTPKFYLDL